MSLLRRRSTGREVVVFGHRFRPTKRFAAAALLASSLVGGCATFGGNVKGSFTCNAPEGTCAPSSVIDDRALAMISGDRQGMQPAGPVQSDREVRPLVASAPGTPVSLSSQRVLKIVFPAFVDGQGRFHETSVVRAVVDQGAWMTASAGRPADVVDTEGLLVTQPLDGTKEVAAREAAARQLAARLVDSPAPEKVAAARAAAATLTAAPAQAAKPVAPLPIAATAAGQGASTPALSRESIAADVKRVLSASGPVNKPTSFVGQVED